MAKSKQQLQTQLADRFDVKADRNRYLSAIIGHPDGSVYVVERPGYVWARLGGGNGQIIQVYSRGMLPAYNLPIVVYRLPHRPRDYGIVDLDIDAWASTGTGESNDGGYDGTGYVERHGEQHYYNAGDPVLVHLRAWTPLRIYASSGFVIGVMPGLIPRSGADLEIVHQTIDLTSHVPASGALYVLITVNAAGVLTATDGTGVGGTLDLTLAEIPDTPDGHFRLGAIRLYGGQTSIQETRAVTDIVDLRWPQERLASTITLSDLPTPIDIEHGGTSAITATAAINNLLPSQSGLGGNGLLTDGTNPYWGPVGGSEGGTIVITSLPVGVIIEFGGASIPAGWLECNGAAVSRTTYADLFAAIGTTYGVGDGSTTFNLPDFRGRTGIGQGTGSGLTARTIGATGGEESHVLSTAELPAHTHNINLYDASGTGTPVVTKTASDAGNIETIASGSTGGGTAHNNMPPFVVTAYIIKYTDTATSSLIFDDGATPENVTLTAATGDDVYASRRDHVHPIDQSISPTWTATHAWTNDSDTAHAMYLYRGDDPTVHGPAFAGFRAYGTLASPSDAGINAVFARFSGRGRGSGAWPSAATGRLDIAATEAQTSTAQGTDIRLYTTPNGSTTIGLAATFGQDKSLAVVGAISASNYAGAVSGGGTIATGGFTLTVSGNSTINGSLVGNITGGGTLATGGFTGTIPEAMTFAGRNVANTFTAIQTITAPNSTALTGGFIFTQTKTGTAAGVYKYTDLTGTISPSSNPVGSQDYYLMNAIIQTAADATVYSSLNVRSFYLSPRHQGTGTASTLVGGYVDIYNLSTGAVTNAMGYYALIRNAGSTGGKITTARNFWAANMINSATTADNQYAFYADSLTTATNNYLLYGAGLGRVRVGDDVSIVGGADRTQLTVTGFTTQTNTVAQITRNDGNTNAVATMLTATVNTTGTAAAGLGGAIALNLESSTTADQAAAALKWLWTDATHATRTSRADIETTGPGKCAAWGYNGIDGTARTMIANGTGDVTEGVTVQYVASEVTGADSYGGVVYLEPSDSFVINTDGTNALTLACAADGSLTVQRTAGTDTYKFQCWMVWV